jgi:hypothetical protein
MIVRFMVVLLSVCAQRARLGRESERNRRAGVSPPRLWEIAASVKEFTPGGSDARHNGAKR